MFEAFGVKMLLSVQKEDIETCLSQMKADGFEMNGPEFDQMRALYLQLFYQSATYIFSHDLKPTDTLVKEMVGQLTLLFKLVTWGHIPMTEDLLSKLLYEETIPYEDNNQFVEGMVTLSYWDIEKGVSAFNNTIDSKTESSFCDKKSKKGTQPGRLNLSVN